MLGLGHQLTRADITAAAQAREAGERREVSLTRSVVRTGERRLAGLNAGVQELIREAQDHPDEDGAWTTVLWASVDRQDRDAMATS